MSNVQIEQGPNSPQDAEEQQATQNVRAGQAVLLLALLAATGGAWWMMQDRDAASIEPAQMASAEPAAVYDPAYDDVIVVHAGKAGDASKPAAKTVVRSRAPALIASSQVLPKYPASALRSGQTGTVLVAATIDANGKPVEVRVDDRSGNRAFDRAALAAVKQWRFEPATRNGKPVEGMVRVPVQFALENG